MLFLLFQLGQDRYALEANLVVEVLPLVALKALPGAPRGVAGLIDYRGTPVPVIDVSALALGVAAVSRVSTRLLIVRFSSAQGGECSIGLIVERATEMLKCAAGDFRATGVETSGAPYLREVIRDRQGLIQRVDVAAMLGEELRAALFDNRGTIHPPPQNAPGSGQEETNACLRSAAREPQGPGNFVTFDGPATDAAGNNGVSRA
jgi:chemotaxis-related protein WspB